MAALGPSSLDFAPRLLDCLVSALRSPLDGPPVGVPVMRRQITLGPEAPDVRRAVGATAWVVLEALHEIAVASVDGDAATASVRSLSASLGFGKDTISRAFVILRSHGLIALEASRSIDGRFEHGRYFVIASDAICAQTINEPCRCATHATSDEPVPIHQPFDMPPFDPAPQSVAEPPSSSRRSPSAKRRARARVVDGSGQLSLLGDV